MFVDTMVCERTCGVARRLVCWSPLVFKQKVQRTAGQCVQTIGNPMRRQKRAVYEMECEGAHLSTRRTRVHGDDAGMG